MTNEPKKLPRADAREIAAAEYVLRLLGPEDETRITKALKTDAALRDSVARWRAQFSGLDDEIDPIAPPAHLEALINKRVFGEQSKPVKAGWLQSLALWRGFAVAAGIAVFVFAFDLLEIGPSAIKDGSNLVAALQAQDDGAAFSASYDTASGKLVIINAAQSAPDGRDFELWVIVGDNAPVSLGVIARADASSIALNAGQKSMLSPGATLAVSLEPEGGSATGAPTGPVVSVGALKKI